LVTQYAYYVDIFSPNLTLFNAINIRLGRHKLKPALGYVSKNGCERDSNPCPHQPETYSGIKVAAILKRRTGYSHRSSVLIQARYRIRMLIFDTDTIGIFD